MSEPSVHRAKSTEVATLLHGVSGLTALPARLEALSAAFLGAPYVSFPLIGSATESERLVSRLDGFDCVTYAETVLALGWSARLDDFESHLVRIRYRDGSVRWIERNHYMTTWLDRNTTEGRFIPVLPALWEATGDEVRTLSVLADYPVHTWHPHYLPADRWPALVSEAQAGDLVCFVSARADLDTFHVGLLIPGAELSVRHASRSRGQVIQEPLSGFLAANPTCPGLLVARPVSGPAPPTPPGVPRS